MNKRNSIILGLLFVILIVELIVLAPKEVGIVPADDSIVEPQNHKEGNASQIMKDVHLVEAKSDGKEWELWADRAVRPKEDAEWNIERVKVKFFAANGVTYTVSGDSGQVVPEKNDIQIQGHVVTRSSNGYIFKTNSVFYDSKARRLSSPQEVEMTGPPDADGGGLILTGSDLKADFISNELSVNNNVRAKKRVKGDKVASIQSQRALFSGRTNQARFFGNVAIDMDTMRITGPEASFAYSAKTKSVESVLVGGGIKVTDTDKFATSSSVSVHFDNDKIVFNGAPRVVQNGDELIGDEIVFLDGGRKVLVSNAKAQIDPKTIDSSRAEKKN